VYAQETQGCTDLERDQAQGEMCNVLRLWLTSSWLQWTQAISRMQRYALLLLLLGAVLIVVSG
jgi:hypothetical protein